MRAIYEAKSAIPELGIERGDVVVLQPAREQDPLLVVKRLDRTRIVPLLTHLDRLRAVSFEGAASHQELQHWLPQPPDPPRSRLSLLR